MKIKVTKQHIDKFRNTPIEERTNGFNILDMWQKSGKAEPTEFELVFVDL